MTMDKLTNANEVLFLGKRKVEGARGGAPLGRLPRVSFTFREIAKKGARDGFVTRPMNDTQVLR